MVFIFALMFVFLSNNIHQFFIKIIAFRNKLINLIEENCKVNILMVAHMYLKLLTLIYWRWNDQLIIAQQRY